MLKITHEPKEKNNGLGRYLLDHIAADRRNRSRVRSEPEAGRGLLVRLYDRWRGWQAQRQTLRLLYSLDDATLRDIGISPRNVDGLVYGAGSDSIRRYDHNWWRL